MRQSRTSHPEQSERSNSNPSEKAQRRAESKYVAKSKNYEQNK